MTHDMQLAAVTHYLDSACVWAWYNGTYYLDSTSLRLDLIQWNQFVCIAVTCIAYHEKPTLGSMYRLSDLANQLWQALYCSSCFTYHDHLVIQPNSSLISEPCVSLVIVSEKSSSNAMCNSWFCIQACTRLLYISQYKQWGKAKLHRWL